MYQKRILWLVYTLLVILVSSSSISADQPTKKDNNGGEYLAYAESMPAPVGGIQAVYKRIKYPDMAVKAGVQGKVYVLAFINDDGTVGDVKIVKGIGAGCDEAAIAAVKASKFTPGQNKGKNVKVKLSLSIQFKL